MRSPLTASCAVVLLLVLLTVIASTGGCRDGTLDMPVEAVLQSVIKPAVDMGWSHVVDQFAGTNLWNPDTQQFEIGRSDVETFLRQLISACRAANEAVATERQDE